MRVRVPRRKLDFEHPGASWQHRNSRTILFSEIRDWGLGVHSPGKTQRFREVRQAMPTLFIRRLVLSVLSLHAPHSARRTLRLGAGQERTRTSSAPQAQTAPGFSISVTVPVVSVDVVVTDNNGNYLKDLKKENFRISEDGTVQTITNFAPSEAPITIVLLLEFSKLGYTIFYLQRAQLGRGLSWQISSPMTGWRWRRSTCVPMSTWTSRTIATKSCRDFTRMVLSALQRIESLRCRFPMCWIASRTSRARKPSSCWPPESTPSAG